MVSTGCDGSYHTQQPQQGRGSGSKAVQLWGCRSFAGFQASEEKCKLYAPILRIYLLIIGALCGWMEQDGGEVVVDGNLAEDFIIR